MIVEFRLGDGSDSRISDGKEQLILRLGHKGGSDEDVRDGGAGRKITNLAVRVVGRVHFHPGGPEVKL